MAFLRSEERVVVQALAALLDSNPFLPERVVLERQALGAAFVPSPTVWHADGDRGALHPNAVRLRALVDRLGSELRRRLAAGARRARGAG